VKYIKRSFLEGRQFTTLEDLNGQLEQWLSSEANMRIHGTTRVEPLVRYQEEMGYLSPYQPVAVPLAPNEKRKVSWDSHISFKQVMYSVPPEVVNREVEVIVEGEVLRVRYEEKDLVCHAIAPSGSPPVTLESHMLAARHLRKKQAKSQKKGCHFEQVADITISAALKVYEDLLTRSAS